MIDESQVNVRRDVGILWKKDTKKGKLLLSFFMYAGRDSNPSRLRRDDRPVYVGVRDTKGKKHFCCLSYVCRMGHEPVSPEAR